ncbi:MAG TPA: RHS repeat-associated core domain-containing protein [Sphingomicrobium sp.]|nr:RHS repeat-associated core domain-containing protein [Sphingomicrobium sp.]
MFMAGTVRWANDGTDAIAEQDLGTGAMVHRYVFAPGIDEPVVQYDGSGTGTRRFLSADERGSVISLSDGSGGLVAINAYDEYGRPGSGNSGMFQYTGQKWIGGIGAYDYKARAYFPRLGTFAQTDPIGYSAGSNLYAYVTADPVNYLDPFGLDCVASGSTQCPIVGAGDVTIVGKRLQFPGLMIIGGAAALGGYSAGFIGATGEGGAGGQNPDKSQCPVGSRFTFSFGPSFTVFGGVLGVSATPVQGTISVPWSAYLVKRFIERMAERNQLREKDEELR